MAALATLPAGQAFLVALREFLDRYGHRELVLSTALQPTWKDAPELVLGLIQGFAQSPPPQTSRPAWEAAQTELLAHPLLRHPRVRASVLDLIATARAVFLVREDTHFEATRVLPILRRTLLELERRLAATGVLENAEAVFHLTLDESLHAGESGRLPRRWPASCARPCSGGRPAGPRWRERQSWTPAFTSSLNLAAMPC